MASTADRPSASPSGSSATSKSTAAKPKGAAPARGRSGPDGDTTDQNLPNPPSTVSLPPRISPPVSAPASAATSTFSSRESSPVRVTPRASSNNLARASRSHKSSTSPSPNRGAVNAGPGVTTVPSSATAVQTAFSQLSKPDLQQPAPVDPSLDVPSPDKSNMPPPPRRTSDSASRAPTPASRRRTSITRGASRSPGPANASRRLEQQQQQQQQQQQESTPANISTKRSALAPPPEEGVTSPTKANADDSDTGLRRGPSRTASGGGSTLETVEEASLPSTPMTDKTTKSQTEEAPLPKIEEAVKQMAESGSESGGNKSSGSKDENRPKAATTRPSGDVLPKRSFTSLNSARKPGDGSVRNMIVETETVTSIPQVSLGVGTGERGSSRNDQGGTVRMKPSMETIRPKKEKKKSTRKPTGNASSKADIFEAKVASAVDEADVSDSDETFVYESNPPDPHPGRQHRYHSRTPSTTSMASQVDQFVGRSRSGLRDGHGVTGKRSMKFTNNNNYNNLDGDGGDLEQGRGSGRVDSNGHSSRHHHFGRHGRGGVYPSFFDGDSPFPQSQSQASRSSRHYFSNGFRQNRRGNNPRAYQNYRTIGSPKNMGDAYADDFDGDGADDERTPLVGSGRGLRSRNGRRPNSASLRQMEYLEQRHRTCFSRYGGCLIAAFLVFLLIGGAATLLVALTKPLLDVHVTKISNVLASEQEIMLDLNVNAINPNIFPIAIGSMDVNLFARSRYVGSEKFWRDHGPHPDNPFPRVERSKRRAELAQMVRRALAEPQPSSPEVQATDGVDRGTDPIPEDPSGDAQTMLLGRVFEFDSPLIFDPSPWARQPSSSSGGIRLARPGNKTEEGGTERWERVLQHPFELIVRGVVKYSLPLSSSVRSASISSKVQVSPDRDGDDDGGPRNDTVRINRRPVARDGTASVSRMFSG
ncbi:hypothetical protein VTN96DRAFT_3271 [Rasamsonia emersonii]|uniref:Phospholipid metabolism enzyme regulator n=1 Tax=Rasamsonia emersonii (strain ATCC 16479 / CBS 393.64 / IMI 116815) TaxID=1408163 RepID=A0A0F4YKP4_RASE3|nr:Phospholipid metabolism enzyme regulator [Rasamsonia emersonii CBS 393.64]KKA18867.1 Phospholipid metabolism enzyme regulator [Rasamsonia emersonii CBS 393.64]